MTEAIFNHQWSDQGVARSAGLFAIEGAKAAQNTLNVLEENGMNLKHAAKQLTLEEIEWATIIFTMTSQHKYQLMDQYPGASDKIFTLKEYVNGQEGEQDVHDPFGGDMDTYRQTFIELQALIDQIFEK